MTVFSCTCVRGTTCVKLRMYTDYLRTELCTCTHALVYASSINPHTAIHYYGWLYILENMPSIYIIWPHAPMCMRIYKRPLDIHNLMIIIKYVEHFFPLYMYMAGHPYLFITYIILALWRYTMVVRYCPFSQYYELAHNRTVHSVWLMS